MADKEVQPNLADCIACKKHDTEVNQITTALAGFEPPPEQGPGTGLSTVFSWFMAQPPGCECSNRAALMDVWGGPGCLDRFSTIMGWLRESAYDSGYPFNEWVVSSLLRSFLKCYK